MFFRAIWLRCIKKWTRHPFWFTYETGVFILVEIGELKCRIAHPLPEGDNSQAISEEEEILGDKRVEVALMNILVKEEVAAKYKKWVLPQEF